MIAHGKGPDPQGADDLIHIQKGIDAAAAVIESEIGRRQNGRLVAISFV